jgi:hypothetical protein
LIAVPHFAAAEVAIDASATLAAICKAGEAARRRRCKRGAERASKRLRDADLVLA